MQADHAISTPSVSTKAPEGWADAVAALAGNIYHSAAWADITASERALPLFFSWSAEGGEPRGVAVGIQRWSPLPVVGSRLKHLEFETYPAVRAPEGEELPATLQHLVRWAKANGFLSIQVGSYMAPRPIPELESLGLETHPRLEFRIDLARSDDEIIAGFSSHHRRKLRKATKQGLQLREATTLDAMRDFRRLQVASRDRRLDRGEDIGVLDDSFYEDLGRQYFRHALGRVFLALHDGEPVSAAFVSLYGGRALYVYGGSSDAGFRMDAPAYLFQRAFSRCRELGCAEFNLGGVPAAASDSHHPSHGLYRFKSGFGGVEVDCLSGSSDQLHQVYSPLRRWVARVRG